jgi:non-specific serine/threonine protein kinase
VDAAGAEALLDLAEDASPRLRGADGKAALAELEGSHDQLLAAMGWFLDQGPVDEALRLAIAMYRYWITQQSFAEGAEWFDRVLDTGAGDPHRRGSAHNLAGFMPFWMGDDDAAAAHFGRGQEIGLELEDAPMISQALGGLARVALRKDVAEGRRLAAEALAISDAADDDAGRSNALHLLGVGAQIAGDLVEARDWMTQRLAMVRASGNQLLVASEAANLSMVERQLGHLDEAEALDREALEICVRIGDQFTRPFAIAGLAAIATERGQYQRAATLVGAAEGIMEAQAMAWPPDERPHYDRMLAVLPEAMGEAAFEEARSAGRATPADDLIAYALEGRPS